MPPLTPSALLAVSGLPPLFSLLAVLLLGVVAMSLLLVKFRQSLLAGYFLCGVVLANSGLLGVLGGDQAQLRVSQLAEFGIMLLMFTLGLEFSLSELRYLRKAAFRGGGLQMAICGLLGTLGALVTGLNLAHSVVVGAALALSSTAVSLKMFQDLGLTASSGARFALGIAIFQDLFVIAFFVLLPVLLSGQAGGPSVWWQVGLISAQSAAFIGLSMALAKWVIPRLLHAVASARNGELFSLTVIGLCVGLAFLGGVLHLSLALGAFVAGLAVSESIYKHRILSDVLPLKHLFLTLFFISTGLLVDLRAAQAHWLAILCLTAALIVVKLMLIGFIGKPLGLGARDSFLAAATLASGGEFSLVLLQQAGRISPWPDDAEQILLGSIAFSMGLVPLAIKLSGPAAAWAKRLGWKRKAPLVPETPTARMKALTDHAIICGYGVVGERLVATLKRAGVPTLVVELNAETVRRLHKQGQPVLFADAAHRETWDLARLQEARLAAFTFPDATVSAHALAIVREINPEIPILARTRFASDIHRLKTLGVSHVVQDEVETARAFEAMMLTICEDSRPDAQSAESAP